MDKSLHLNEKELKASLRKQMSKALDDYDKQSKNYDKYKNKADEAQEELAQMNEFIRCLDTLIHMHGLEEEENRDSE